MSRQATLFQSWGKRLQPDASKDGGATSRDGADHTGPKKQDTGGIVDLCDDDDDDMLLAMAMEESLRTAAAESAPFSVNQPTTSSAIPQRPPASARSKQHVQSSITSLFKSVGGGAQHDDAQAGTSNSILPDDPEELPDLSNIEDLPGFDKLAGCMWIYPTNYQIREYQYKIVRESLFTNTLVTLPTGLGKTFIAAVVMYNFYRWYPQGKVVFMAPTKPLVAQQIEACYNIMGIPQGDTAEMTGAMQPAERKKSWHNQRVFFLTPQVLVNDLSRGVCPAEWVKCLVVDEAHKALGNHAYCQVVRELVNYNHDFRVLALSATPGSDLKAVQQVLTNLLISRVELRTEESPDIQGYSFQRIVDKVVVPLGQELTAVRDKYLRVLDMIVVRLRRQGVLYNRDAKSLSKFMVLKAREAFRQDPPPTLQRSQQGAVEGDFAMCMSLYHGYELLQLHGLRSLYSFMESLLTGDKGFGRTRTELQRNGDFMEIIGMLREKFNLVRCPIPNSQLMSPRASQLAKPQAIGHPKMEKLQEIILEHFVNFPKETEDAAAGVNTRVMIFSQYRDSVNEITEILNTHRPLVRVMSFIGQSSMGKSRGFTQKEQLKVMRQFREGGYNTLVSTCVGEEGLDIGDVDLIICFDAHKSPIRLVQRMGRTGRKRQGRIVMLVTEGKEEKVYNQSQYSKRSIHRAIQNGAKSLIYYPNSSRMVPKGLNPVCRKMDITVQHKFVAQSKTRYQAPQKQKVVAPTAKKSAQDCYLTEEQLNYWSTHYKVDENTIAQLPESTFLCLPPSKQARSKGKKSSGPELSLTNWLPWQNRLQETFHVSHSVASKDLVELMDLIDVQNAIGGDEDNYGQEMKIYLNEDDIIRPGAAGRKSEEGILRFCAPVNPGPKQGKRKLTDVRDGGQAQSPFRKLRRSETLPVISSEESSNSDDDLPEFDLTTAKSRATSSKSITSPKQKIPSSNVQEKLGKKTNDPSKIKGHGKKKKKSSLTSAPIVQLIEDHDDDDFLPDPGGAAEVNDLGGAFSDLGSNDPGEVSDLDEDNGTADMVGIHDDDEQTTRDVGLQSEVEEDPVLSQLFPVFTPQRASFEDDSCAMDNDKVPSLGELDTLLGRLHRETGRVSPKDLLQLIDNWEQDSSGRRNGCRKSLQFKPNVTVIDNDESFPLADTKPQHVEGQKVSKPEVDIRVNNSSVTYEPMVDVSEDDSASTDCIKETPLKKSQHQEKKPTSVRNSSMFDLSLWDDSDMDDVDPDTEMGSVNVPFAACANQKSTVASTTSPSTKALSVKTTAITTSFSPMPILDSAKVPPRFSTPLFETRQPCPMRLEDNSFFDDDDDDDNQLLAAVSTPALPPLHETSQITFTQALACVHDSVSVPSAQNSAEKEDSSVDHVSPSSSSATSVTPPTIAAPVTPQKEGDGRETAAEISAQFDLGFDLELDDFEDEIIPPSPPSTQPFSQSLGLKNKKLSLPASIVKQQPCSSSNVERSPAVVPDRTSPRHVEDKSLRPSVEGGFPGGCVEDPIEVEEEEEEEEEEVEEEEVEEEEEEEEESSEDSQSLLVPTLKERLKKNVESPTSVTKIGKLPELDSPVLRSPAVANQYSSHVTEGSPAGSDFLTPIRPPGKSRLKKRAVVLSDDDADSPVTAIVRGHARSSTSDGSSPVTAVVRGHARSSTSASSVFSGSHDDDFEDDDFQGACPNKRPAARMDRPKLSTKPKLQSKKKKGPATHGFLDLEAEVSDEDGDISSDEADIDGSQLEASFVNDCTHLSQVVSPDNMRAIYMQSVRSPAGHHGAARYRLEYNPGVGDMDVFSQVPEPDYSNYEHDSFCVATDEEIEEEDEESFVELRRPRNRRRKPIKQTKQKPPDVVDGRRRIRKLHSSSSEEDPDITDSARVMPPQVAPPRGSPMLSQSQRPSLLSRCLGKLQAKQQQTVGVSVSAESSVIEPSMIVQEAPTFTLDLGLDSDDSDDENNTVTGTSMLGTSPVKRPMFQPHRQNDSAITGGRLSDTGSAVVGGNTEAGNTSVLGTMSKEERLRLSRLRQQQFREKMAAKKQQQQQQSAQQQQPQPQQQQQQQNQPSPLNVQPSVQPSGQGQKTSPVSCLPTQSAFDGKPVVLVDSREISGAQELVSCLRFEHKLETAVRQLAACDYIVSTRMAVERKMQSDFTNGAQKVKLLDRMRHLCEHFDRPCLIIESDRVKSGEEKTTKTLLKSKYVENVLACLAQMHIKVLYSNSQQGSAKLLAQLVHQEQQKKTVIQTRVELSTREEQILKFYLSLPKVNFVNALYLMRGFTTIQEFISSTASVIEVRGRVSPARAQDIHKYIRHEFDSQMVPK